MKASLKTQYTFSAIVSHSLGGADPGLIFLRVCCEEMLYFDVRRWSPAQLFTLCVFFSPVSGVQTIPNMFPDVPAGARNTKW